MIGYLDTSALVPLLIEEPTSAACRQLWDDAEVIVSSRLLYVETAAALAQALRMKRLRASEHHEARGRLDIMWAQIDVLEINEPLVARAAELTYRLGLRGYDAMHAAAAEQLDDDQMVAAAGDHHLLGAWRQLGLATYDTTHTPPPPPH